MTPEAHLIQGMLKIADKQGHDVPFLLNPVQRSLDEHLSTRNAIPKARQEGVSSYILARFTIICLTRRNIRAVVISHESDATARMLAKVHYFLENMRPQPVVGNASKGELTFPKMNSMFYIGTAGSRAFGRGDTITHLHCSEVAFWPDAKTLMTGLLNAVPEADGTEIFIESTGNGQGDYYHKLVENTRSGKSHYRLHFFNWQDFPEYNLPTTEAESFEIMSNLDEQLGEVSLVRDWGLQPGQIKFRRHKLAELEFDVNKFSQEYPMTIDECFQSSGKGIFKKVRFVESPDWVQAELRLWKLKDHPKPGHFYIIGADVGAGIGQDRSPAEIFDLSTLEQVGEYVTDSEAPDDFGHTLARLGEMFNMAFITVEANNYGITTLDHLESVYPEELIYTETRSSKIGANEPTLLLSLGFRTTHVTKPFLIGKLRTALATDMVIHSPELKSELSTFVEKNAGGLEAENGCFDDRVIAAACAVVSVSRATTALLPFEPQPIEIEDPFSIEAAVKELRSRSTNGYPIKSQVE